MTEHMEYRSTLCERRNNRTNAIEWVLWFKHPTTAGEKPVWLDIEPGRSWFVSKTDYAVFCACIERRLTIAIKFVNLADAYEFLNYLRPAEIKRGDDNHAVGAEAGASV